MNGDKFIIVKMISGQRFYLSDIEKTHKSPRGMKSLRNKLGSWTRKKKKAHVFSCNETIYFPVKVVGAKTHFSHILWQLKSQATNDPETNSHLSYKNRSHSYYGRSLDALKTVRWLFNMYDHRLSAHCKVSILELGGEEVWSAEIDIDLSPFPEIVRKQRSANPLKK